MQKHHLASAALLLLVATPAVARDTGGYVGVDVGAVWPNSQDILGSATFAGPFVCNAVPPAVCTRPANISRANVGSLHFGAGVDADLFGGYDFGMFRLEGETGYKSGHAKHATFNSAFISAVNTATGDALTTNSKFNIDETSHVWDIMMNGWLDLGGQTGVGGGVGGGLGYANVDQFGHSNGKFAWQLLAQAYYPVSHDFDIGIKYRYFHAGETHGTNVFTASPPTACNALPPAECATGTLTFEDSSRWTSHSILLTAQYNFGHAAPLPPPPPPPPLPPPPAAEAPAMQTCPDGSVVEATATCPAPPPPPPPPAPAERGN